MPADTKVAAKPDDKAAPKVDPKATAVVTPVPAPEAKVAQVTPAVTPAVPAAEPGKETPKVETKPGDAKTEPPKPEVVADAKPAEVKAAPPKKVAPPPPPPEASFIEENAVALGGGTAAVLGLGGLFLFMSRRKKKVPLNNTGMTRTSSIMPSDLKPNTVTGNKGGGLVDTGNSSFLTDFDKTGPGSIDTDEVDPLAEADVYIAYGRDAQAEEILKEALGRDKGRHEVTLKLLEIYHNRKSVQAFETLAREFKDNVGESNPLWAKASAMGAAIDPQNSLYSGSGSAFAATGAFAAGGAAMVAAAPEHAPPPDLDFDLGFTDSSGAAPLALDITSPAGAGASASGAGFDLDLNTSDGQASHADIGLKADAPAKGLDFDLALDAPAKAAPASSAPAAFDFDLSLEEPSHLATQKMQAVTTASTEQFAKTVEIAPKSSSFGDLSLDLDTPSAGAGGGHDGGAVATKLELAKAYVEIGDTDGAKDILNEVAREGSANQQAEAKKLLAGL
ncbi:MAG: FimV/HubP family polar landmark protein [Usitatibacteraceae bacterium]